MKISTIEVRYMRRVQVQQFEPAEAEVKLQATVTEGEVGPDASGGQEAAVALLVQARGAAHQVLLGTAQQARSTPPVQQAAPAPTVVKVEPTTVVETKPKEPAAPQEGKAAKPKVTKDKEQKPTADAGGIPGEDPKPATPTAAANSDIPSESKETAAPKPTTAGITANELQTYIAGKIHAGKMTVPDMRALMSDKSKGFDVTRLGDLTPELLVKFKDEVDKLCAR